MISFYAGENARDNLAHVLMERECTTNTSYFGRRSRDPLGERKVIANAEGDTTKCTNTIEFSNS